MADTFRMRVILTVFSGLLSLFACQEASAEMVRDSNTAYFAGERFDLVLAAPRGFKLITTEANVDGYACAFIPEQDEYANASLMLGVNFFKIRGMSFERALTQDTANMRALFGSRFTLDTGDPLLFLTGDTLRVLQLSGITSPMSADFFGYFNAGTEMLILEASRTHAKSAGDSERLLRSTTALARVLTRAELETDKSKPDGGTGNRGR